MQITIKDVAKEAGVAPSTVSRVLNGNPRISEATREIVMEAVKKLNYYPNTAAQSLVNRATRTIGIVIPSDADDLFKNPFWIHVIRGISMYAQKNQYYISFATSNDVKEEMKIIKDYVMRKVVDGIILLTARINDQSIEYLQEVNFPFSVVGKPEDVEDVLWVDNDNFGAMYEVVNELVDMGHKKIGFISGPQGFNMSKDRLIGYKNALQNKGIVYEDGLVFQGIDFTEEEAYQGTKKIFSHQNPTAIVTTDDILSLGVVKFLKETGNVNVSVVGFNNAPVVEYQDPPLASVDIKAEELGYYGAKLLIEFLQTGDKTKNYHIVPTELIKRKSMFSP